MPSAKPVPMLAVVLCLLWIPGHLVPAVAQSAAQAMESAQRQEVIYGRKHGVALTMEVFTPESPQGLGCILAISGGWVSHRGRFAHPLFTGMINQFLERGYIVFAVVHGSQPKYTIPEILEDMHRAVRFIRHHSTRYGVDPDRLGITGGSAGGHLSLMQATAGLPADAEEEDPVDQQSSRVAAVACFFPPTDFLNYGKPGEIALGRGILKNFRAPFDFHEFDSEIRSYVPVRDVARILELGREISPITHVSGDDPPTLIIHGDADKLVPIQQSQLIVEKFQQAGVPVKLVVQEGGAHGNWDMSEHILMLVDWFDTHLMEKE